MAGEMPGAYFISYFSALGMEPAFLKIRLSKIIPSFFTIKEGFILPLRLSCKESSTSNQAFLLRRKDVNRPTRCSEPLRSKVGGPSKVFAMLCGMGPP